MTNQAMREALMADPWIQHIVQKTAEQTRITLTNVNLNPVNDSFTANLHVDGKPLGLVENDGRGGCHLYSGSHKELEPVKSWATEFVESGVEALDHIIDCLVDDAQ